MGVVSCGVFEKLESVAGTGITSTLRAFMAKIKEKETHFQRRARVSWKSGKDRKAHQKRFPSRYQQKSKSTSAGIS
jgi:hypothetical protein